MGQNESPIPGRAHITYNPFTLSAVGITVPQGRKQVDDSNVKSLQKHHKAPLSIQKKTLSFSTAETNVFVHYI